MNRRNSTPIQQSFLRQYQQAVLAFSSLLLGLAFVFIASAFMQKDEAATKQPEDVFRVCKWITAPDGTREQSVKTAGLLAPELNRQLPGTIAHVARFMNWPEEVAVTNYEQLAPTEKWAFADPAIMQLFNLKAVYGNVKTALNKPGQLVLTDRYAKKLFGSVNPVGKTLMGLGGKTYTVAAVVEHPASHVAIQFDVIASWASTLEDNGIHAFPFLNNWTAQLAETFIRLEDTEQKALVQQAILEVARKSPHPSGCTDIFIQSLNKTKENTSIRENAEQDRFGARVSPPGGRMVLVAGGLVL